MTVGYAGPSSFSSTTGAPGGNAPCGSAVILMDDFVFAPRTHLAGLRFWFIALKLGLTRELHRENA